MRPHRRPLQGNPQQLHPERRKLASSTPTHSSSALGHHPRRKPHDRRPGSAEPPGPPRRQAPAPGFQASGGGFSHRFRRPSYQNVSPALASMRASPTSPRRNPNPNNGAAVVTSDAGGGYTISEHGGTSASAPIWAGIIAPRDQYADATRLRQPDHLPDRPQPRHSPPRLPTTIPAGNSNTAKFPHGTITGYRRQPGLGPRHRLGKPERPRARSPARFLRGPLTKAPTSAASPPQDGPTTTPPSTKPT